MNRCHFIAAGLLGLTLMAVVVGVGTFSGVFDPLASPLFKVTVLLCVVLYLLATAAEPPSLRVVLGVAIAIRVMLLIAPPMLSSDLYRYVWDGRVQMAGINPYLFVPDDQALAFLRDGILFPQINRADTAHTIYPPMAQVFFAITHSLTALRLGVAALDGLTIFVLIRLLDISGQNRAQVLIYAWNPLVFWEFANNAHIDALAVPLLLVAVLALIRQRPIWAGLAFGAAVMTKFLPIIVAPALWRLGRWKLAYAALALILALYATYATWDHAGWQVFGFLGGYSQEEGLDTGSGYWLLAALSQIATLPGWASAVYVALVGTGMAALGWVIAFRNAPVDVVGICRAACVLITALLLTLTPHYAWYYAWLAAFAVIAPSRAAIYLSSAALLLYHQTLPDHAAVPGLIFIPTLLLLWVDWRAPVSAPLLLQGTR